MTDALIGVENFSAWIVLVVVLACALGGVWAFVDMFISYGKARLITKPTAPGLVSTRTAVR